ncbi:MAG: YciI family protein [Vicinamibacterales bacterium]
MKYMLMMHAPGTTPYQILDWPKADLEAHIAFMRDFAGRLGAGGELVAAEGLAGPDQAKLVRGGANGEPVTDGVFPETKEFLVGYWIVEVESAERAYEVAAEASMAPGAGGAPLHLAIEVRQVMSGPPTD